MNGNVWEYVWPADAPFVNPNTIPSVTAMGGDFLSPSDPRKTNAGFGAESPFAAGSYNIGFRVVRGPTGPGQNATGVPAWKIERGQTILAGPAGGASAIKSFAEKNLPMTAVPGAGLANARDFVDPRLIQERNKAAAKALDDKFLGKAAGEEVPVESKPGVIRTP
jgi:hypothetical protein